MSTEPVFFAKPSEFRAWLQKNHAKAAECWVGYYKKGIGRPSMTWPESVDEALCFGWIDGIRKSVDADAYKIRFTPRKPTSIWSAVNIGRAEELIQHKRMKPAGLAAFEKRDDKKSKIYAYEQHHPQLDDALEKKFRKNRAAWAFFQEQPPSYRKLATWWIVSAKRPETRLRRLDTLIADSAAGRRLAPLAPEARRRT